MIYQLWVQTLSLGVEVGVQWPDQQLAVIEKLCRTAGTGRGALVQDSCQDWEDPGLFFLDAQPSPSPQMWADTHGGRLHG